MKRLGFCCLIALLVACGSSDPGTVNVKLELNSTVTPTIQTSIKQFIFFIGDSAASTRTLYPTECLGCSKSVSPCPKANQCLKFFRTCGYSPTAKSFDPVIDFNLIGDGKTMSITSCALDVNQAPVAAGVGTAKNADGSSATIIMSTTVTSCSDLIPPLCGTI